MRHLIKLDALFVNCRKSIEIEIHFLYISFPGAKRDKNYILFEWIWDITTHARTLRALRPIDANRVSNF